MEVTPKTILLVGESDVGKSHYGGQLLKRLMQEHGRIRMDGGATNLEPFETVMASLDAGRLADHTATTTYHESRWPIIDEEGRKAQIVWPDYGGEQIKEIVDKRQIPHDWMKRIAQSSAWLFLIRLQKTRTEDDVFSRPLTSLRERDRGKHKVRVSDQARLVELLQMLIYVRLTSTSDTGQLPRLVILLTCWDEMDSPNNPIDELREWLPMFGDFVASHWEDCSILGLSSLERTLDKEQADEDYINQGSEKFGYVVLEDGTCRPDLTLPIQRLLAEPM